MKHLQKCSLILCVLMLLSVVAPPFAMAAPATATATTTVSAAKLKKLSKSVVTVTSPIKYTGKARKPAVTVEYGSKTLKKGTDYTVKYQNNVKPGVAKVTVTAVEGSAYTGSKTVKFKILPAKVKGLTVKKKTETTAKLSWKAVQGATGYVLYGYDPDFDEYDKIDAVKKTTAVAEDLDPGEVYRFAVRAYVKSNGKNYYSSYSKLVKAKTLKAAAVPATTVPTATQPVTEPTTLPATTVPATLPTGTPTQATIPSTLPTTQPVTQPTTQPVTQPVTQPTTQPVSQPTTQPVTQPTTQPVTQPTTQPVTQPTTQPATQPTTQAPKAGETFSNPLPGQNDETIEFNEDRYEPVRQVKIKLKNVVTGDAANKLALSENSFNTDAGSGYSWRFFIFEVNYVSSSAGLNDVLEAGYIINDDTFFKSNGAIVQQKGIASLGKRFEGSGFYDIKLYPGGNSEVVIGLLMADTSGDVLLRVPKAAGKENTWISMKAPELEIKDDQPGTPGSPDSPSTPIITIQLPATPALLHEYRSRDNSEIIQTYSIDKIEYVLDSNSPNRETYTVTLKFGGQKTYDINGTGQSSVAKIAWKLYDADGSVVGSGSAYSPSVAMGESWKPDYATDTIYRLKPGNYRMEISSVN